MECYCCLAIAPRARLVNKGAWIAYLIGDGTAPAAFDINKVEKKTLLDCTIFTPKMGEVIWYLSNSPSASVGPTTFDKATGVLQSAP